MLFFSKGKRQAGLIQKPIGFDWYAPIRIYRTRLGTFLTDYSATRYRIYGKEYFVSTSGNDANDGLTLATAFRKISTAVQQPDVDVIWLSNGMFNRDYGFNGIAPARSMSIMALPGAIPIITTHSNLTWTLETDKTYTYKATRSLVTRVLDSNTIAENGDYLEYTLKTSVDEVEVTPGSYYTDGATIWVHRTDGAIPDTSIWCLLSTRNFGHQGGCQFYLEGLTFLGGNYVCDIENTALGETTTALYARSCKFKYGRRDANAFQCYGANQVHLDHCEVAVTGADGFNYHAGNGVIPKVLEVGCKGRDVGTNGTHQCSTAHDGVTIIRLNSEYYNAYGSCVTDITAGTKSWMLGCYCHGGGLEDMAFQDGTAWLDGCRTDGQFRTKNTTVYTRQNCSFGSVVLEGAAQKINY